MDCNYTAVDLDEEHEFEDFYSGDFWNRNERYNFDLWHDGDYIQVILEDEEGIKYTDQISEYAIVKGESNDYSSPFQVKEKENRGMRVFTSPAKVTEDEKEQEIEAYLIQTLRNENAETDTTSDDILVSPH